jgi:hypothetical protein
MAAKPGFAGSQGGGARSADILTGLKQRPVSQDRSFEDLKNLHQEGFQSSPLWLERLA